MNPIKKVFFFVFFTILFYCIFSFITTLYGFNFLSFNNVNLLGDIIVAGNNKTSTVAIDSLHNESTKDSTVVVNNENYNFSNYKFPGFITAFQKDTSIPSLSRLDEKLFALKKGKKVKIRIAYLGDSMIEGDLLTQTLRKLLQGMFGGYGVGFVPVTSHVAKFRITATDDFSDNWQDDNFKTSSATAKQTLFFSGHTYRGNNSWVVINDRTVPDSVLLEKSLLCGRASGATIEYNDQPFAINTSANINRILLKTDYTHKAKLGVNDANIPIYGISFESPSGIFVDNFSFRGISGVELNTIDSAFLKTIDQNNPYDLIILAYGVNVLFRPNDTNFGWYHKLLAPVITKFKRSFPNSDIIIVSTADRAFRYNGEYKSAVGIDSLVKMQASLAYDNGICFYNQFATMGGANSIVEWATQTPSLANKDYIHPNLRGSEILAGYFYKAILNDYNKYLAKTNAAKNTN